MRHPHLEILLRWLRLQPAVFSFQESGDDLKILELFSGKTLALQSNALQLIEERANSVNPSESYVIALFESGRQLVFSKQGFAFPPDYSNTGPLSLPNPVYCMQDYFTLMNKLRHVAAEPDRGREGLDLILVLIALLDGAKAVGMEVDPEIQAVEEILAKLEKGETLAPPH